MKISSYFILLSFLFVLNCTPPIYVRKKITRSVSKGIVLTFSVNQIGNFQSYKLIASRDIINLFDPETTAVNSAEINAIDIKSVSIGAKPLSNNTATQVVLGADVMSGALLDQPTALLNDTKTITISNSTGFDFGNALGAALETTDELTLYNALTILNAKGADKLREILAANLQNINRAGLSIRLKGIVPAQQRLVMSLEIKINASITFTRCETIRLAEGGSPEDECF